MQCSGHAQIGWCEVIIIFYSTLFGCSFSHRSCNRARQDMYQNIGISTYSYPCRLKCVDPRKTIPLRASKRYNAEWVYVCIVFCHAYRLLVARILTNICWIFFCSCCFSSPVSLLFSQTNEKRNSNITLTMHSYILGLYAMVWFAHLYPFII